MLVLDASVAIELLLGTPLGLRCAERVLRPSDELHAPELLDVEFMQVLRRLTLARSIAPTLAEEAIDALLSLPLYRHGHSPLLARVWELRESASAYDAAYLALAEGLRAPLVTCDARLHRSHGHRARVELLA